MANIMLHIANTGELVPVNDLDLESVTSKELIDAAIQEGILHGYCKEGYALCCGCKITPYYERKALSSLGILDGDTVSIVLKPGSGYSGSF